MRSSRSLAVVGICALVLSERAEPPESGLADTARRILETATADAAVHEWITTRAERGQRVERVGRSGERRDGSE